MKGEARKPSQNPTMYATTQSIVEMFADNTAGESTTANRLITRETDEGNVTLIGYGWLKLAEYDEERGVVRVFAGHRGLTSRTVSRWLNEVVEISEERGRTVVLSGESPVVDAPNRGAQFINNYVGDFDTLSPQDKRAMDEVVESLSHLG